MRLAQYLPQLILAGALLIMMLAMSCFSEYFFAWSNFRNILDQSAIYIILAVGMTFVIASGGVDLSVGCLAGLAGVIMAALIKSGLSVQEAIGLGFLASIIMGMCNGLIISILKINAFITTLATMTICLGLSLIITGGTSIWGFPTIFTWFGTGRIGPINPPIFISISLVLLGAVALKKTLWGKYCLALGSNNEALRRTGVNTCFYHTSIYVFSSACAAIVGLIMTARLNSAAPTAGSSYEMDAIAAVVLGGTGMAGGKASVIGTLLACLILAVLRNGLTLLAMPTYYQKFITGLIILTAIILAEIRNRRQDAI